MGRWSTSDVLFITLNYNITILGKVWLILMVLIRILVLLLAVYPLYQDEQENFVCNTIQPGCANVCYDAFSPLSLLRFWLVQLVTLCLPCVLYMAYVIHKVLSGLAGSGDSGDPHRHALGWEPFHKASQGGEQCGVHSFSTAYLLHSLLCALLEAGFGTGHYYLFGFRIPKRFFCQEAPCTAAVDCYVSRPTEKTAMLTFMLGFSGLSLLIKVIDLIGAIKWSLRQRQQRKKLGERKYEEEQYFLPGSVSVVVSPTEDLENPAASCKSQPCVNMVGDGADESSIQGDTNATEVAGANTCNESPLSQEGRPEHGAGGALPSPAGTPRPIRVRKHSHRKPPPPPRRDKDPTAGRDVSLVSVVRTRALGQKALVEMIETSHLQFDDNGGQEKRREWV